MSDPLREIKMGKDDSFQVVNFGSNKSKSEDDGFKEVTFSEKKEKADYESTKIDEISDGFKTTRFGVSNNRNLKGEGARYDICMVFPTNPNSGGFQGFGEVMMKSIRASGAETYAYYNAEKNKIFVLIRYSLEKLTLFADSIDFKMLLDPHVLEKKCLMGDAEKGIAPLSIGDDRSITKFSPYEYIYCRYEAEDDEMYWRPQDEISNHSFTENIRLKVTNYILEFSASKGGAALSIRNSLAEGKLLAYFPMPNLESRHELGNQWLKTFMTPNGQPFEMIRSYFGEKIVLFFEFRAHLTYWLGSPAIIGLALECVVVATYNFSHPVIPFFSLYIAGWSALMTEYWKRRESAIAMKAGMNDMERDQVNRPEFQGREKPSLVDGHSEVFYPKSSARLKVGASFSLISVMVLVVVGVVAGIYTMRFVLYQEIGSDAQVVASVVNVVQIQVLTFVYEYLAFKLTDMENQQNDVKYEDSMIVKLFVFQFVNNYASFYYLAFIAGQLPVPPGANSGSKGECGYSDCMQALAVNLGIIFGSRLITKNFLNLFLPYLKTYRRRRLEEKFAGSRPLSPAEQEFIKEPFDMIADSLRQFADVSTFFGYTVYFTSALPAAPFFAWLNTYLDIRFSAYSMLLQYRRPILVAAQDIGTWQSVFEVSSTIGVITNAALIIFTMTTLDRVGYTSNGKLWIFIGFQWVLFTCQMLIRNAVGDEPTFVKIQRQRTDFITSKIIDKVADEECENVAKSNKLVTVTGDLVVNENAPGM